MICDLIVTFIESGGYVSWVENVKFYTWNGDTNERTQVSYGDTWADGSTFYDGRWSIDIKDDEGNVHTLGWKKLKWALERPSLQKTANAWFEENYDVNDADNIVQMSVFKEIVYG